MQQRRRLFAIDYGTRRIGLAMTDPLRLFAQPVGTFDQAGLMRVLHEHDSRKEIDRLIVGYPVSSDGTANAMTEVVDRFVVTLQQAFPHLAVELQDERCSSRAARQILVNAARSRKERNSKGRIDSAAACVLLSDYLETERQD